MISNNIASCIVLYNPDSSVIKNIQTFLPFVDNLIIIDNSVMIDRNLTLKLINLDKKIIYINNNGNLGIAKALNQGCQKAIELNYNWILTMDQDSYFKDFSKYLDCFYSLKNKEKVSLISPNPFCHELDKNSICSTEVKLLTLTSGTLLNLKLFNTIGSFTEKLFIDEVDHDYCLRSKINGFKVLEFTHIPLIHSLGDIKQNSKKKKSQHNPLRVYYITRNSFYMASQFSKQFPQRYSYGKVFYRVVYKKIFRILRHEDNKLAKIKSIASGILDFVRGNYGKVY